jgi:hypothetical protein
MRNKIRLFPTTALLIVGLSFGAQAQVDPGPRTGLPNAGGSLATLTPDESAFFMAARDRFQEVDSVSSGLGPRFNGNSCAMCHAQPAVGGTSPANNPLIAVATLDGAQNTIPSFITPTGPVREARFINLPGTSIGNSNSQNDNSQGNSNSQGNDNENSNGSGNGNRNSDGGVHDLFTITGRADAPGCALAQPDFASELKQGNVIFRIPTPLFGLGLVEDIPDNVLEANAVTSNNLGIPTFQQ